MGTDSLHLGGSTSLWERCAVKSRIEGGIGWCGYVGVDGETVSEGVGLSLGRTEGVSDPWSGTTGETSSQAGSKGFTSKVMTITVLEIEYLRIAIILSYLVLIFFQERFDIRDFPGSLLEELEATANHELQAFWSHLASFGFLEYFKDIATESAGTACKARVNRKPFQTSGKQAEEFDTLVVSHKVIIA